MTTRITIEQAIDRIKRDSPPRRIRIRLKSYEPVKTVELPLRDKRLDFPLAA